MALAEETRQNGETFSNLFGTIERNPLNIREKGRKKYPKSMGDFIIIIKYFKRLLRWSEENFLDKRKKYDFIVLAVE